VCNPSALFRERKKGRELSDFVHKWKMVISKLGGGGGGGWGESKTAEPEKVREGERECLRLKFHSYDSDKSSKTSVVLSQRKKVSVVRLSPEP